MNISIQWHWSRKCEQYLPWTHVLQHYLLSILTCATQWSHVRSWNQHDFPITLPLLCLDITPCHKNCITEQLSSSSTPKRHADYVCQTENDHLFTYRKCGRMLGQLCSECFLEQACRMRWVLRVSLGIRPHCKTCRKSSLSISSTLTVTRHSGQLSDAYLSRQEDLRSNASPATPAATLSSVSW